MDRSERLDDALSRHPAGAATNPRSGYGLHMVALRDAQTLPVHDADGTVLGHAEVPAVHVLECYRCGTLLRIGSPHALTHTVTHRWQAWGRTVRGHTRAVSGRVTDLLTRRKDG